MQHGNPKHAAMAGFTLSDLLALLTALSILVLLFIAARARAGNGGQVASCLENMRRLSLAWQLYANDHQGRLIDNYDVSSTLDTIQKQSYRTWANNVMDWTLNPINTNLDLVAASKLFPYLGLDPEVFKCPSDAYLSATQRTAGWSHRARSYSMNGSMGAPFQNASKKTAAGLSEWLDHRRQFVSLSTITRPSEIFVFLDEHPDSINNGLYLLGDGTSWGDMPASYHNGACSFSFADGHAELHGWQFDSTKQPVVFVSLGYISVPRAERGDWQWMAQRTTVDPRSLVITRTASNEIQLVWSQLAQRLQQCNELTSGAWTNIGQSPIPSYGQNALKIPIDGQQLFFRAR
jgi:prepilin-type processing-associated H-X9-DG protein